MRNKFIVLLLTIINSYFVCASQIQITQNNPFHPPQSVSCEDLTLQLIAQLKDWQYQGYLQSPSQLSSLNAHIWLTDQKRWLEIANNHIPVQFLPWQFLTVSPNEIVWQIELPNYCGKAFTFTMQFKGK